ncbi:MAG: GNAT family N-acetyltransferase [Chloroflexota bacterium]
MTLDIKPASDYLLADLTQLLNLSFENYLVPITFNLSQFLTMIRKDSVDLSASRVLLADGESAGIALIARRGWTSRLAAMGIMQSQRGKSAGSWFMDKLIQEARERNDHDMVLEVIEQNEYAVRLYKKCGFQSVRKLIGLIRKDAKESTTASMIEIDLRQAGSLISQHGLSDLPWQLAGETIAHMNPPARAYRNGPALVVISNPDVEHVVIWSVLVEPDARGKALGVEMLKCVIANYTGKTWHVPAIFPEEFGNVFERAGFEREELTQSQMRLSLS